MPNFNQFANEAVRNLLKTLLEEKHLYQSVSLIKEEIETEIQKRKFIRLAPNITGDDKPGTRERIYNSKMQAMIDSLFENCWNIVDPSIAIYNDPGPANTTGNTIHRTELNITSIRTHCGTCKEFGPMNLLRATKVLPELATQKYAQFSIEENHEVYTFSFQCQNCRDGIETFIVTRKGGKLTLVGRTPMEQVQIPSTISKNQRGYYSGAVIAFNSGQILPALFMLRTTLEQFVREETGDANNENIEELFNKYKERYSKDFNSRHPSLYTIYTRLSIALHSANEDESLYTQCREEIDLHFAGRQHYLSTATWKARNS